MRTHRGRFALAEVGGGSDQVPTVSAAYGERHGWGKHAERREMRKCRLLFARVQHFRSTFDIDDCV